MVTGFIKLNGMTVGAVANCTTVYDEEGKESREVLTMFFLQMDVRRQQSSVSFCRRIRDSGTDS